MLACPDVGHNENAGASAGAAACADSWRMLGQGLLWLLGRAPSASAPSPPAAFDVVVVSSLAVVYTDFFAAGDLGRLSFRSLRVCDSGGACCSPRRDGGRLFAGIASLLRPPPSLSAATTVFSSAAFRSAVETYALGAAAPRVPLSTSTDVDESDPPRCAFALRLGVSWARPFGGRRSGAPLRLRLFRFPTVAELASSADVIGDCCALFLLRRDFCLLALPAMATTSLWCGGISAQAAGGRRP